MNIVDLMVAGGIILAALWGLRAGLINSLLGIIAVFLANYFSAELSQIILNSLTFLGKAEAQKFPLLLLAIFIFLYAIGAALIWLLKKMIEVKVLGPVDTVGGLILSAVKFMLMAAILVQMLRLFPLPDQVKKQIKKSYLMEVSSTLFKRTYPIAESAVPQVKEYVNKTVLPVIKGEKESNTDMIKTVAASVETFTKELGKSDSRFIDIKEILNKKSKP